MSRHTCIHFVRRVLAARGVQAAFTAGAFIAVALVSPPTDPAPADMPAGGPSAAEARALDDLAVWIFDQAADESLAEEVVDRRVGFELFRTYGEEEVRRSLISSLPHGELIWSAGKRWGVDPLLVAAIVENESNFDAEAISVQGALGLMQVLPETAALFRPLADPFEPAINVEVGTRYFASQLERFDGDVPLALAAYNAGPGNVMRFAGIPPFRETQSYVERVLASYVNHLRSAWRHSGELDWLIVES